MKRILALLMLLLFLCPAAGEALASARTGSLTVVLPGAGGELKLYSVDFVPPEKLTSEYAGILAPEMPESEGICKTIGADGRAVFENLSPGVYLLCQTQASAGYQKICPFFVTIPMAQGDGWSYEITACPKAEKTPGDDGNPDTGQAVGPVRLLCLSLLGLLIIMDQDAPEKPKKSPKER